jgi:hypothetical protein
MQVNKFHIILLTGLLCGSCIVPYEPDLEESQKVVVINGMISDRPGRHEVTVSLSSPYRDPVFQGMGSCVVTVTNQDGNTIRYTDQGDGVYAAYIPDDFLSVGDQACLIVEAPDGNDYYSSCESILASPELDTVYWELGTLETSDPEFSRPGIQFYLDMTGKSSDSRNVIWRVQETWEYWASLFGNRIMTGWGTVKEFRTNVIFKCWKSYPLDRIYTATTRNLSENRLVRFPLNFVSNETDRLSVTYSLYVQQQSVSDDAYDYWKRMNEQSSESGGMYEKQPASVPGNIQCANNPDQVVLGYFYASQVREQRIFVHNNNLFDFNVSHISCEFEPMSTLGIHSSIKFPVYLYVPGPFKPSFWGPAECFDCRLQGGDTIRPEIWETW